eukprot:TRINITY_DN20529_c0_g3_i2.p1 TRINITY_DN20529_c0_g3~~TRINITY_DN20529_c0_g3_i2.p1  ORF type:complete len:208 (+),score=14.54 TRINITY_DN20529_c0_g3_i2:81-704(+)
MLSRQLKKYYGFVSRVQRNIRTKSDQSIQEKQVIVPFLSTAPKWVPWSGGLIGFLLLGYGAQGFLSGDLFEHTDLLLLQTKLTIFGGVAGGIGVGCGAFGFHGLRRLLAPSRKNVDQLVRFWEIATNYLLIHSAALVGIGGMSPQISVPAQAAFATGICLFSGSIFVYVLSNIQMFQYFTPFGGMAYMIGWAAIAVTMYNKEATQSK